MKRAKPKTRAVKKVPATALSHIALKDTMPKGDRRAELRHFVWDSIPIDEMSPVLGRQLVVGQNIMLARVLLKKGCIVPEHSHPNEQLTFIAEGALRFWIDGEVIDVNAGECLTIPPNMPHKAEALEDTVDYDVFNPPRADWMNKTDTYLK